MPTESGVFLRIVAENTPAKERAPQSGREGEDHEGTTKVSQIEHEQIRTRWLVGLINENTVINAQQCSPQCAALAARPSWRPAAVIGSTQGHTPDTPTCVEPLNVGPRNGLPTAEGGYTLLKRDPEIQGLEPPAFSNRGCPGINNGEPPVYRTPPS